MLGCQTDLLKGSVWSRVSEFRYRWPLPIVRAQTRLLLLAGHFDLDPELDPTRHTPASSSTSLDDISEDSATNPLVRRRTGIALWQHSHASALSRPTSVGLTYRPPEANPASPTHHSFKTTLDRCS